VRLPPHAYQPPGDSSLDDADEPHITTHRERLQEREVRRTAQRLLADHLRPGPDRSNPVPTFWSDIDLDLTGAILIDFDLTRCKVHTTSFRGAIFAGLANFEYTTFTGDATFMSAKLASLRSAAFAEIADFQNATFNAVGFGKWFQGSQSEGKPTTFGGGVYFESATFAEGVPEKVRQHWSPPDQDGGFAAGASEDDA
jgi:hypothetical protein